MDDFDKELISIIKDQHPDSLEDAVKFVRSKFPQNDKIIMGRVLSLESEEKISFKKSSKVPSSLTQYFWSGWSRWFWVVVIFAIVTSVMIFLAPEDVFPLAYVRIVFSLVFILYLPGYSLIKTLFDKEKIDEIERFALSIGLSLALVPLVGLLLNYTPWGIRTIPVTLSLLVLTLFFSFIAVVRDFETQKKIAVLSD